MIALFQDDASKLESKSPDQLLYRISVTGCTPPASSHAARPPMAALHYLAMPGKRRFDEQIAALDKLRQMPAESCIDPLRTALEQRNHFVVGKAGHLIREFQLPQLTPELLIAFDRFFENPAKTDPQCWAKNALSRALAGFEHQDAAVFLRGMRHIQLEPVWGGTSDTAATLRLNLRFGQGAMPQPG
jgi:hypothetical protein